MFKLENIYGLIGLACVLSVGIILNILACALFDNNWWLLFVGRRSLLFCVLNPSDKDVYLAAREHTFVIPCSPHLFSRSLSFSSAGICNCSDSRHSRDAMRLWWR
jgi:Vacuolar protein sorting 55